MNFRLYDSAQRQIVDFEPLVPGRVSIYHCGLTVQSAPHLGHIRKEVVFDVLRRWFEFNGNQVTIVANVTDIDDKILAKSAEAGVEWWAHAYRFENELHAAYASLGCLPPSYEPRATGHIPEMIELIEQLIERGHAYEATDGSGDVYFDVQSWPAYGQLSGQRAAEMEAAEDADPRGKRDPRDFALWKGFKADEPRTASWPSPWGEQRRGRPGWHIECSAMAGKYLGDAFDIHGGGLDLRFPHHENELAQSSAAGRGFAKYWMHNAWVTMAGEKMSKSLGNTALVTEVTKVYNPRAVRFFLLAPHYRSMIEFSPADEASKGSLDEATRAIERIDGFLERAATLGAVATGGSEVPHAFRVAMDNDLGTPQAVAALFNEISEGNKAIAAGQVEAAAGHLAAVRSMLAVLGLDPTAPEWAHLASDSSNDLTPVVDRLVTNLLEQRAAARAAKDWAAADAIRDTLAATGLKITDTPEGARWEIAAGTAAQAHEGDKN